MAEAIRATDDDQPRPTRGDVLRMAAAEPDVDPQLARKLCDVARSLDALDAVLLGALAGWNAR